jgi:hypothetical protein
MKLRLTKFTDVKATEKKDLELSFDDVAAALCNSPETYPTKEDCPLLKMGTFGDERSDKGCLRHDGNLKSVSGVEGDYDAGEMTFDEAALRLEMAGLEALICTTASHTEAHPRWRIIAPFAQERTPQERARYVARLNGLLDGVLGKESFKISQTFYFGRVEGKEYRAERFSGARIDTRDDLDATAIGPVDAQPSAVTPDPFARTMALREITPDTLKDLRDALLNGLRDEYADSYPLWVDVGHALKSVEQAGYGAEALELWHEFSRRSSKYDESAVNRKWESLAPNRITHKSIFGWAKKGDWPNPGSTKGTGQNVSVDELRREHQKRENERIGEGADTMPVAEAITLQSALDRFVFLADGSRVADRLNPHYDLALQDFKNTYAASKVKMPQPPKEGKDGSVIQPAAKCAPVAELWNSSPNRRTVISRTYKAGAPEVLNDPRGRVSLNLWKPFDRSVVVDDLQGAGINLFLDQVEFLFGSDAPRFLDWLAHVEQQPGVLPHTAWLHVATQCGLGRNWLASVLTRVWAGAVAANFDLVSTLNSGFNERLSRKVLAVVDEIREGGRDTWTHSETMKRLITEEYRTVNVKTGRIHEEYNSCRWLVLSNHRSALPIEDTDRRFEVVATDVKPRSLAVYTELYNALDDKRFIAAVATYLGQRDISRFNPGREAARSAAKAAVIETSMPPMARWCQQLVTYWPCDLISAGDLLQVLEGNTFNRSLTPAHRYVLERAGIESFGRPSRIDGKLVRLSIVRNRERWKNAAPGDIADHYKAGSKRINDLTSDEPTHSGYARDLLDLIAVKKE